MTKGNANGWGKHKQTGHWRWPGTVLKMDLWGLAEKKLNSHRLYVDLDFKVLEHYFWSFRGHSPFVKLMVNKKMGKTDNTVERNFSFLMLQTMPIQQNRVLIATPGSTLMLTLFLLLKHYENKQLTTHYLSSCTKSLDICFQCEWYFH